MSWADDMRLNVLLKEVAIYLNVLGALMKHEISNNIFHYHVRNLPSSRQRELLLPRLG